MKPWPVRNPCGRTLSVFVLVLLFWVPGVAAQEIKQVTINFIEVEKDMATLTNRVVAYVTVSAADESPVLGIPASDFSVLEDSRPVALEGAAPATDPMAVILAIDTSGSMLAKDRQTGQTSMAAAREAAVSFVGMLTGNDQVAVFSFNNTSTLAIDFTHDRPSVLEALASIEAKSNAATCLYDTAYEAVKKSAEIPRGRRAIILLTDGRDEKGKGACSTYTAADVIDSATTKSIRVPIFTIGVGPKVDARQLGRMASLTGGRNLLAPSPKDLTRFYQTLADQLKNQYRLTYTTRGASGEHSLVVKVSHVGGGFQDEKRFWSPPLPVCPPAKIVFLSPQASGKVKGTVPVRVGITPDEHVRRVRYYVDGVLKKEFSAPPFDLYSWSSDSLAGGLHLLRVEAVDASGQTANAERTVTVDGPPPEKQIAGKAAPAPAEQSVTGWIIGLAVLLCLAVAGMVWMMSGRRKTAAATRPGGEGPVLADMTASHEIEDETVFVNDAEEGSMAAEPVPPATLTVVQSLILETGKAFDVGLRATVGRTNRNDIDIPDKPVSRKHAEIYFHERAFRIRDLGSRNGVKIDGKRIYAEGVVLHDGAEIKLGPRTLLRFNCMAPIPAPSEPEDPAPGAADDDGTVQNFQADHTLRYGE
ncbi:MAG: FHA domain-containing protein [Desulfobacterales bacterium]|nr:FHA domain-containing protein [Desulfobacterales bacterium]